MVDKKFPCTGFCGRDENADYDRIIENNNFPYEVDESVLTSRKQLNKEKYTHVSV